MRCVRSSWFALALAGSLAGCGGGGGGGGGGTVAPRVEGGEAITGRSGSADYGTEASRNWGLAAVGADPAAPAGRIGSGVTVAVIDTGIDLQHQDFAGAIDPASTDIVSGLAANVDDVGGHGTSVAGIIGARRDGFDTVGVAPGSMLLAVRADTPGSCADRCTFYYDDLARATAYASANGAKVLNFSLGGGTVDKEFRDALTSATGQGRIVVAAAGNTQGPVPIDPANWLTGPGAQGLGLAVGATDGGDRLATFSNRAGGAKDFFLVAPGVNITTTANGGGVRTVSGTSFAAPHVAGAAAVVWGAAPYLTGRQVVDILLGSATDLGEAGVDEVYGHGLLNLEAALRPMGTATLPTGSTVAAGGAPLSASSLHLGAAFGDAVASSGALSQAMVLDGYGRPFGADLGGLVASPAPGAARDLSAWLGGSGSPVVTTALGEGTSLSLSAPVDPVPGAVAEHPGEPSQAARVALSADLGGGSHATLARGFSLDRFTGLAAVVPAAAEPLPSGSPLGSPFVGLAGQGAGMVLGRDLGGGLAMNFGIGEGGGDEPGRRLMLGEASKRWRNGTVVGMQVGRLEEQEGPLGSSASGAFAFGGDAGTAFSTLFAATPAGDSSILFATVSRGVTDGGGLGGGLLRDVSTVQTQAWGVGAATEGVAREGDRLSLAVSRPLRVVGGQATLDVPTGRTLDGEVLYRSYALGLTPSGAETDIELGYTMPLVPGQTLTMGGMILFEPGHVAGAGTGYAGGAKYRLVW